MTKCSVCGERAIAREYCAKHYQCDVRNCINPDHLFLGTQADNMEDMVNKGRARNQWTGPLAAQASKDGDANVCK